MAPVIDYRFLLIILVIWQTDANVNIVQTGVKAGDSSFECGSKVVLTCLIDHYLTMSWQNDSSLTPLAECVLSTCQFDPTVVGLYQISPDTSAGVFNLTIIQVTLDNNGTSYTCGDGTNTASSLVTVNDYEPTVDESAPNEIKVGCGCIDPNTDLSLEWIKVKADTMNESPYEPENIRSSFSTTMCTRDINFGPSNFVQKSKSLSIPAGGDGDYFLKVVFIYNGVSVQSGLTSRTYKIVGALPTVTLQPAIIDVFEHGSKSLTCVGPDNSTISDSSGWKYSGHAYATPSIYLKDNTCTARGYIRENPDLYAWSCPEENKFVLTLLNVNLSSHQKTWQCGLGFTYSNLVKVVVKVPVKTVEMTSHTHSSISVKENAATTFICQTSCSRPEPNLLWFLIGSDHRIINITDESDQLSSVCDYEGLTKVQSKLIYAFKRTFQGWNIYCLAANVPKRNVTSSKKGLNVQFPPDKPPVITGAQNGSKYRIVEHESANLVCTVSGGNPLANIIWLCFNGNVSEIKENDKVTGNVSWKARRIQHNKSCICVAEHMFGNRNTSITVEIMYPPSTPFLSIHSLNVSGMIRVIQNNSLLVRCSSSSYPESEYIWLTKSKAEINGPMLRFASVQTHDKGQYICMVNNTMVGSNGVMRLGSSISTITVQILHPPLRPTFNYSDNMINTRITGQSFDVIKGDIFTIHCLSEANPNPGYRWEDDGQGSASLVTALETITKTCTVTNAMRETIGQNKTGSASAMLVVSVLYPPVNPTIIVNNSSGNKFNVSIELKVLEMESFTLTCKSAGRPSPKYRWYVGDSEIFRHVFQKMNVSRNESGRYTCNAFNTMIRTLGKSRDGSNNRSIDIDVLYPAEVGHMESITVIEGDFINITCPVIPGNPAPTRVTWLSKGSLVDYSTAVLHISNASRYDEDTYICSVKTTMKPTYSQHIEKVNYGDFHLTVVYKAHVKAFYIWNQTERNILTVNETDKVTFMCDIGSKPSPSADISVNENTLFMSQNNTLVFTKESMKCTDFGTYTCSGMNDYNNGIPSTKSFILYVNCSPRPSPDAELKENVTSTRHTSATLSFTAIAYPEPGTSGYIWFYINGSERVPLSNSTNIKTARSFLQSNLTITNVTEGDYGRYVLQIINKIGVYEQWFNLILKEKTTLPTEADPEHNSGLVAGITVTSVTIAVIVLIVISVYLFRKRLKQSHSQKVDYDHRTNMARIIYESS